MPASRCVAVRACAIGVRAEFGEGVEDGRRRAARAAGRAEAAALWEQERAGGRADLRSAVPNGCTPDRRRSVAQGSDVHRQPGRCTCRTRGYRQYTWGHAAAAGRQLLSCGGARLSLVLHIFVGGARPSSDARLARGRRLCAAPSKRCSAGWTEAQAIPRPRARPLRRPAAAKNAATGCKCNTFRKCSARNTRAMWLSQSPSRAAPPRESAGCVQNEASFRVTASPPSIRTSDPHVWTCPSHVASLREHHAIRVTHPRFGIPTVPAAACNVVYRAATNGTFYRTSVLEPSTKEQETRKYRL